MRRLAVVVVVVLAASASAQVTITPAAPGPWTFNASASALPAPPASYIAPGFETPPLGTGSVHLIVGSDGSLNAQARNTAFAGTLLSDLTALSYSTYVDVDGSGGQAPYLNLLIDQDNNGTVDDQLFFEPVYQTGAFPGDPVPNQGAIQLHTWQTWDARNGGWWSLDAGTFGPPLVTLATYSASFPNARIVNSSGGLGGLRILVGSGAGAWDNFVGAADNVTVDTSSTTPVTYDFEPLAATVVTVTPAALDGWTLTTTDDGDATNTATVGIVPGPATPPMGTGSLELSVGADGGDAAQARNNTYDGQLLRDLSSLTYHTYVDVPGSGGQAPYIILNVDYDNNGTTDDFLFFEPVYQDATFFPTNPQPAIVLDTWQSWDARNGGWWSANNTASAGPGTDVKPLGAILDVEPDAKLATDTTGAVRIVAGFGQGAWDNFLGYADALSISFTSNVTTYDFEPTPAIGIGDVSQTEGTGGATNFTFTLTLSHAVNQSVTVDYTTADGTATAADLDYTPVTVAQTATFAPNATTTTITIAVTPDAKFEPTEDFFVNLVNPQGATISDPQARGEIVNDDPIPTISIADLSQNEGNAGVTPFSFTVTLSNPSHLPVTIDYTTNPGTATADGDYTSETSSIVINPGLTSGTITIDVIGDLTDEADETFFVDLTNATNATFFDNQAIGTIIDDDGQPTVTIDDVSQNEGNAGTTPFTFTVTLSNPSAVNVTVNYTTTPGTATAGTDYTSETSSIVIPAGSTSGSITIDVVGDTGFEANETFFVNLTGATAAAITDNQGTGTILNDDGEVADLSITKTGPSTIRPGFPIQYLITVSNAGPQGASNVVVTDIIPAGTTFISAVPSQGTCTGTSTVICTLGAIASGGSATITLTVQAPGTPTTVTNTATVANTPQADPNAANNTSGPTVTAVAHVAGIPTLSEWGLIALLSALLLLALKRV